MTCLHLQPLEKALLASGIKELFRGKSWSDNCREWVYFDCLFTDLNKTIDRFQLDRNFVRVHSHLGRQDGQEQGLVCSLCQDGIMGMHPEMTRGSFTPFNSFE